MTNDEFLQRYRELGHAVQTGIKMKLEFDLRKASGMTNDLFDVLKHIRVGVDTAKSDEGAVGRLLIEKGVFTEQEYFEAILKGLEAEVQSYELLLEKKYGLKGVKLG